MNTYVLGNTIELSATFSDADGQNIDPSGGVFLIINRAGNYSAYHYGAGGTIQRETTGSYYIEVQASQIGGWNYYWFSSGTVPSASSGQLLVVGSGV